MEELLPLTWPQYKQQSITDIKATVNSIKSTYMHHCGCLYPWSLCVAVVLHAQTTNCRQFDRILAALCRSVLGWQI
jgi:hypothetical protein